MHREYVIFKLGEEHYGIEIKNVENIEKNLSITRVPNTKPYIKGVVNLRGNVIPIMDLRQRLGLDTALYTEESRVIIVNCDGLQIGMIVDKSSETLQLNEKDIEPSPSVGATVDEDFVKEIGKHKNRIIMLINLRKILGISEEELDR